jgi:hypothetical protein
MKQAQRVAQAHTEIARCNVELRRLHTAILDEESHFVKVLDGLKTTGQNIYYAVLDYCTLRRRVNRRLLFRIAQTYALKGFTGNPIPGVKKSTIPSDPAPSAVPSIQEENPEVVSDEEDVEDLSDDDELADDVRRIVDYISVI